MPYVKLDCGILDSTIWLHDAETRVCWITLLAMADAGGMIEATAPGIAHRACLSIEATRKALLIFESPDPDSKTGDGRRIERIDGGYLVINYDKYRHKDHTAAERKRRQRAAAKNQQDTVVSRVTSVTNQECHAKAYTEADKELSSEPPVPPADSFQLEPPKNEEVKIHREAVIRVFEHYLGATGRSATVYSLTDTRRRQGEKRLQECLKKTGGDIEKAVELMVIAIDALSKSDFHMGRDKKTNGKRYCEWEHVFRSYEQMEKWWNQE